MSILTNRRTKRKPSELNEMQRKAKLFKAESAAPPVYFITLHRPVAPAMLIVSYFSSQYVSNG